LDVERSSLRAADREIELRPKSFGVLRYLVENADRLVTKEELISAIWPDAIVTDDSLTRCVSEIRSAIGPAGDHQDRPAPWVSVRHARRAVGRGPSCFDDQHGRLSAQTSKAADAGGFLRAKVGLARGASLCRLWISNAYLVALLIARHVEVLLADVIDPIVVERLAFVVLEAVTREYHDDTAHAGSDPQRFVPWRFWMEGLVAASLAALSQSVAGSQPVVLPETRARLQPPLPDRPSIAVLPFTNMSDTVEQGYFADGLVEEIITALSRFSSLFVIARNSTFTYKGRAVDMEQVGRELGVHYVLEGSVRKTQHRVRIAATTLSVT
jgi:TolB-like protein